MDDLRKFGRYFLPYKVELTIGIICILASVVFNLYIPLIVGQAIDANWSQVTWSRLTISALKVLGASIVSGTFLFLQRRILIGMSRKVEYDLRQDFYAHLVNQPQSFFQEHRIGDLMARATNDLAAVRQLAGPMIMYSLQTVFVVVIVLPLMFLISWRLTLLLFVTMPLVSLTVKFFGQQVHVRFEKIQDFFSQITARAQENFTGVRVVRAYAQEGAEIAAFNELNRQYAEKNIGARQNRRLDAAADAVSDRHGLCADHLGRRAGGDSRRDHGGSVHRFQHVSLPPDLAADRAGICGQPLPARHRKLETDERHLCRRAFYSRCRGREHTAADQRRDRIPESYFSLPSKR